LISATRPMHIVHCHGYLESPRSHSAVLPGRRIRLYVDEQGLR
jgi:hypothetical protein